VSFRWMIRSLFRFTLTATLALPAILGAKEPAKEPKKPAPKVEVAKVADSKQEDKKSEPMSSGTFEGLKLRSIGPAMISGRVVAFAVDPANRAHYYVAAASGGVWKTVNNGTTWTPVFDHEGSYSIGDIKLDPKDPNVVWVGTGESNSQRSVSYGDGVYRSEDGGESWKNVGLKRSEHVGRIVIDPRDSNVVYAAAEGPLWSSGGERGLYKTTDGGKSWSKVLDISENTGVGDVAMDPQNPDVLYAAAYQRQRKVWTLIDGGPESAIYKSTDAGKTWNKLTSGLPKEDMGRIGLAISPIDNNLIYATVEAANKTGGIFRSRDAGATWEKRNSFDQTAMYYGQIFTDPKNPDRIYVANFMMMVSDDGGKTLTRLPAKSKHVDNHVIWIDPHDPNYYLVGCDGGVYESYDRAAHWEFKANLPLAQFYDVAVDNSSPFYFVYGGTQDNNALGAPSRTTSASGITNADWFITQGGDGFRAQVDPEDANTIYAEYQEGGLTRFDKRTGERTGIQPQETDNWPVYRWNWDSPILISPHSRTRLYFGANKLFRSDDRGDTWRAISPDLTRQIDRNRLAVMGKVWGPDAVAKNASTSFYSNLTDISESPVKEGLLYVGTDDGLIQSTEDGGQSWRKLERFPGVPENTYVSRVAASRHDVNTVYAAFENHKEGDFKPYLLKSTDLGKSWSSITGDLPDNGPVLAFAEDAVKPNLLFAGTEFGLFFTVDGGKKWLQLKGGLPTIALRDLVIQTREGDLVAGTFGRGIYILDDIRPLRELNSETLNAPFVNFPVRSAWLYNESQPYGDLGKAHMGESFYAGENPPFGATFTYYLKEKIKTRKETRQAAEKDAAKAGKTATYATADELVEEADEAGPAIVITITDASGNTVRRLSGPVGAGMQRVTWNLRYPEPILEKAESDGDEDSPPDSNAPLVIPGNYTVSFARRVDGVLTAIGSPQTFVVAPLPGLPSNPEDRLALIKFQQQVAELYRALTGTAESTKEVSSWIDDAIRAIQQTPAAGPELLLRARAIESANRGIGRALAGNEVLVRRNEPTAVSIDARVRTILSEQSVSSSKPTQTHLEQYKIASEQLAEQAAKLRNILESELPQLERELEAAGAPWTPGRIPVWGGPK